jgi:hypothetical protein
MEEEFLPIVIATAFDAVQEPGEICPKGIALRAPRDYAASTLLDVFGEGLICVLGNGPSELPVRAAC